LVPTGHACVFPQYFARVRSQLANYQAFPLQYQSEQLVSMANPGRELRLSSIRQRLLAFAPMVIVSRHGEAQLQ
jgi:hypothetical protein